MNIYISKWLRHAGVVAGILALYLIASFVFSSPSFAGFYSVKAYDSIAGYGTEIRIANASTSEKVKIFVLPPVGDLQTYLQTTKPDGTASFILSSEKTKTSGIYKVVVVEQSQSYSDGVVHSFEIFPDDFDASRSFFYAIDQTIPTGAKGKLTLLLRDKYDNPITGHRISLKSNRSYEKFTSIGEAKTNDAGEVSFIVQSAYSGDALINIKDETYGESVAKAITVRFYNNAINKSLMGDTTMSSENSLVAKFSLDFPDTVPVNSDANYLTITALDASGNRVKDFKGSVLIKIPTDANATIPAQNGVYTFTEADQGSIVFSRSLLFSKEGKHRIEVYSYNAISDETNVNIFGKKEVTVENKTPGIEDPNTTPISIITPSDNTILAAKSVIITGTALKNTDLQISLDGEIVKSIETDDMGEFSTTIFDIKAGEHKLQIQQKNNLQNLSKTTSFRVGEGVGSILSSKITPSTAVPKATIEIQMQMDTSITPKAVDVSVNNISYPLSKIKDGLYQGSFPAPSSIGEYSVTLAVQNTLGEIQEKILDQKLIVQNANTSSGSTVVTNLSAEYIAERKVVQLSWTAITPEPLLYIIHSGSSKNALQKSKSVRGVLSSTEIEIDGFSEKYFAIAAVDIDGKEGPLSESILMKSLATPTPTATATPTLTPTPTATQTPIITPSPTALPEIRIRAISKENTLQLEWDTYPSAKWYMISYGYTSKVYQETVKIPSSSLQYTLKDLIGGSPYFITLEALDTNGKTLYSYKEITEIPFSSAFHNAAMGGLQPYPAWTTQTGPQFSVMLGGLFLLFSGWILFRREKYAQ